MDLNLTNRVIYYKIMEILDIKDLSCKDIETLERLFIELNNYALLCKTSEVHEVNVLQNKVFEKLQSYKR